jgi:ferredoxin/flavodoxin---NADP+ reductase
MAGENIPGHRAKSSHALLPGAIRSSEDRKAGLPRRRLHPIIAINSAAAPVHDTNRMELMPVSQLRVAVVGSGPAGIYATDQATRRSWEVDIFERLPCPYGLLRYGIAPDHAKMKSLESTFQKVLNGAGVRFFGGVEIGKDLTVDQLRSGYNAVVYAVGAHADHRLQVPNEDLTGSMAGTEFVGWYNGHPDVTERVGKVDLSAQSIVVLGAGNVALDVARILALDEARLRQTDVPEPVLAALSSSAIRDIHIVSRRGPTAVRFTSKELRELGEIVGVDPVVDPNDLVLDGVGERLLADNPNMRRNYDVMRDWSTRTPGNGRLRIFFRFGLSAARLLGAHAVTGVEFYPTEAPQADLTVTIPAQLVLRCIGSRGTALAGVPFDAQSGQVPNDSGRVLREGKVAPGEYVVGWIKRGPSGVIGTNRSDALDLSQQLAADAASGSLPKPTNQPSALLRILRERRVAVVEQRGWTAIVEAEHRLGRALNRDRVKITQRGELLSLAANQ